MEAQPHARPRLRREQAQAATRLRLLESAAVLVADRGWAGTSLEEVAEAAGFSIGAIYSNFRGKRDLFTQLAAQRLAAVEDTLAARLSRQPSEQGPLRVGGEVAHSGHGISEDELDELVKLEDEVPPGWWRLLMEVRLQAATDPALQGLVDATDGKCRTLIADYVRQRWAAAGLVPPVPPEDMADVLIGLVDGLRAARAQGRSRMSSGQGLRCTVAVFMAASRPA